MFEFELSWIWIFYLNAYYSLTLSLLLFDDGEISIEFSINTISFFYYDGYYFSLEMNESRLRLKSFWIEIESFIFTLEMEDMIITNVVPFPYSLSIFTFPPIFSIMCLQMLRPRPVPCLLTPYVSANLLKLRNSLL